MKEIREIDGIVKIEHSKSYIDIKNYCLEHKCPAIDSASIQDIKYIKKNGHWEKVTLEHPILRLKLETDTLTSEDYKNLYEAFETDFTVKAIEKYNDCGLAGITCLEIEIPI